MEQVILKVKEDIDKLFYRLEERLNDQNERINKIQRLVEQSMGNIERTKPKTKKIYKDKIFTFVLVLSLMLIIVCANYIK